MREVKNDMEELNSQFDKNEKMFREQLDNA